MSLCHCTTLWRRPFAGLLLLIALWGPLGPRALGQEMPGPTPIPLHAAPALTAASADLPLAGLSSFFPAESINQRRVIQFAAIVMCLALYIMFRQK